MTKQVRVGPINIGGGAPISVQSMTNTDTRNIEATTTQIAALANAGCDIVRVAVFDMESANAMHKIVPQSPVPLVADVHFDHKLAIKAIENGVHKLRINPGNIGGSEKTQAVADCAKAHNIPIRIGVNAGSLERAILSRDGKPTAQGMAESAINQARLLEQCGFYDIVLSLKASNVVMTIEACRAVAKICDYPQHIGVTEAGMGDDGIAKNALGIGALLLEGIGDTIRVSLTGDPLREVSAGYAILEAAGVKSRGLTIISCPTCGRCRAQLEPIIKKVRLLAGDVPVPVKAAVMGCVVNGPGEAREADCGVACGEDGGALFSRGVVLGRVPSDNIAEALAGEIHKIVMSRAERG